jgi:hypothetical protein
MQTVFEELKQLHYLLAFLISAVTGVNAIVLFDVLKITFKHICFCLTGSICREYFAAIKMKLVLWFSVT